MSSHGKSAPSKSNGLPIRILLIAIFLGAGTGISSAARAQDGFSTTMEIGGVRLSVSPGEMASLSDLGNAVTSRRWGAQDMALAAADRVARSRDARYVLALYQLEIGIQRRDDAMRAKALDVLIPNSFTPARSLPGYLSIRGDIAFRAGDFDTAAEHWTRLVALKPRDPDALANLAQLRRAQDEHEDAAQLLARAIAARESSGPKASESWYRQRLTIAHDGRSVGPATAAAHALVAAYPTARNWRDSLVAYRQVAAPKDALEIDLLRLMRATGSLARTSEYQRLAQLLMHSGQATEAKAVLGEGLNRGLLKALESPTMEIIAEVDRAIPKERARIDALARQGPPARSEALSAADSLFGVGRIDEAIALYRTIVGEAPVNSARLNVRLGTALVAAGRHGEAEASFRAAAEAASAEADKARYADIASFWLAWLTQRHSRDGARAAS